VSDPLGLGVQTASDGAVIDATGRADGRISALGPLRRGELYESTAVPELRAQAAQIAATLVELPARSAALAPYPHGAPSRSWAATHGAGVGRPA
jgi:uncharacterized NAD(P)/FAD-binding protein YdhS